MLDRSNRVTYLPVPVGGAFQRRPSRRLIVNCLAHRARPPNVNAMRRSIKALMICPVVRLWRRAQ